MYGVRYQLLASDTLHNKWTTVIKSYKPFSTISEVLKGELENAAHYSFFGSVDNGLGSSGIQEASAYETFIFHEYDVFFQREPSIEELDRWTQALVSHTARPKDLVKDCMTSEDFEKSGLTLGEKIVVMCASCGMGEISDEQVQQWIGRFEAGLTMEEAAEELTGTEDFEQFLSIFQFELDK